MHSLEPGCLDEVRGAKDQKIEPYLIYGDVLRRQAQQMSSPNTQVLKFYG